MAFDVGTFGQGVATSAANLGLNAIGSVVNGLVNNLFYRRNLDLQTQKQKELIDYQNEYNTPSAQMSRLLEAGLNPNLVYGSQAPAGISGNASAPSGHAPDSYNTADVGLAMLQAREMQRMDAEKEVLSFKSYIFTKVVRFLLLQTVVSQDVTKKNYCFVPDMGKYNKSFTDTDLCKLWKLSQDDWEYIDSKISNIGGDSNG